MQFDLRFYVVALLFIIFDVEVAFFFPWATVFGKATHLMDPNLAKVTADGQELSPDVVGACSASWASSIRQCRRSTTPRPNRRRPSRGDQRSSELARTLAQMSIVDILVFFAVLLVGFAYVWNGATSIGSAH